MEGRKGVEKSGMAQLGYSKVPKVLTFLTVEAEYLFKPGASVRGVG
ncbi:uncharacterized protein G2W53_007880 [Senna tora]|uniref:Uncharacterized protein n=1 Tax=Senna tora TaxID=362788 RepID=A0A834X8Y0_9FABA|nr:uncharacterized protein G2W53_007880 [Senna tora]